MKPETLFIDHRYFDRTEPTLPSIDQWKCSQNIKDYWWSNCEPIDDEMQFLSYHWILYGSICSIHV